MSLIRKGDTVVVISGPDKGLEGEVLEVDRKRDRVLVKNVNIVYKHRKVRQTQAGREGGIVEEEAPIHISNVMFRDPETGKPARLGVQIAADGSKTRITRGRNASGKAVD